MKKRVLRKLREMAEDILGKEETNKIIEESVKEVLEETKPKKTTKKGDK